MREQALVIQSSRPENLSQMLFGSMQAFYYVDHSIIENSKIL